MKAATLVRSTLKSASIAGHVCPDCCGMGTLLDYDTIGRELRKARLAAKCKLDFIACSMKLTISYISELERGSRSWDHAKLLAYAEALQDYLRRN